MKIKKYPKHFLNNRGVICARKSKIEKQITNEEKMIAKAILSKVYDSLQYDKDLSDCGHLSPNATFTDGGRFIISMDRVTFEKLDNIINKL